jgi:hypothetical protein
MLEAPFWKERTYQFSTDSISGEADEPLLPVCLQIKNFLLYSNAFTCARGTLVTECCLFPVPFLTHVTCACRASALALKKIGTTST